MPKPVTDRDWSKTWARDDLQDLGNCESYIWKEAIRSPIELALAEAVLTPEKDFFIDCAYGNGESEWIHRKMDDVFKPLRTPASEDDPAFRDLVDDLSEIIWDIYADDSKGYAYFRFRAAAMDSRDLTDAWEDGHADFL